MKAILPLSLLLIVISAGRAEEEFLEPQRLYQQYCASCHGADYRGGNSGSLSDGLWRHGSTIRQHLKNTKNGITSAGMPAFVNVLSDQQIQSIIEYCISLEGTLGLAPHALPTEVRTLDYILQVEEAIPASAGLETPWAIDFIDSKTYLITERPGRLRIFKEGALRSEPIKDIPAVLHAGQGGLLDVTTDPEVEKNGWVYLSFSHELEGKGHTPAMTKVVRGKLKDNHWVDEETVFEAPHATYINTRHHYGSRIDFDSKGYLYFTIGDRGRGSNAQDLDKPNGKLYRVWPDGRIPEDNPFVNTKDALPAIYSYGHRNPQGLAIQPKTDAIWSTEHGPMGGDELNFIEKGANYGWETLSFGRHYNGKVLTTQRYGEGYHAPAWVWRPSTAVCGLDFYEGKQFPYWEGHLLVGALRNQDVRLMQVVDNRVIHEEIIFQGHGRVRDVAVSPDGAIYVVLNKPDRVVRLSYRKDTPY